MLIVLGMSRMKRKWEVHGRDRYVIHPSNTVSGVGNASGVANANMQMV